MAAVSSLFPIVTSLLDTIVIHSNTPHSSMVYQFGDNQLGIITGFKLAQPVLKLINYLSIEVV